jgi:two-component system OmpR family response regulator
MTPRRGCPKEPELEAAKRILLVDDDRELRDLVSRFLVRHGYKVTTARDAREMTAALAASAQIDLIVLDVMLPGRSGLELCRDLRAKSDIPILALGEETDRIIGLEMGADDYLPKPFNSRELLARIRAILRRTGGAVRTAAAAKRLRFSGWTLDRGRRRLEAPDGVMIDLTSGEYELLAVFAEHPQRVLSRDQLLDLARGREAMPFDRSIDVQVSRVRRKIENDPKTPAMIVTVRGDGYMFTPEVEAV